MNYRILVPVTNSPELVDQKIKDVPDPTKLVLVNNLDNPEVADLCRRAHDHGATLYEFPFNLGLAPSWNLGLRCFEDPTVDVVFIMSVSAVFDRPMQVFIDHVAESEAKGRSALRYMASGRATMHCFAHTRRCNEVWGDFDENCWPAFYEDHDYTRRGNLLGFGVDVVNCGLEDVVHSRDFSNAMRTDKRLMSCWEHNAHRVINYCRSKWGGDQGSERFTTPFNDPTRGIHEWSIDVGFNNTIIGDANWRLPTMSERIPVP